MTDYKVTLEQIATGADADPTTDWRQTLAICERLERGIDALEHYGSVASKRFADIEAAVREQTQMWKQEFAGQVKDVETKTTVYCDDSGVVFKLREKIAALEADNVAAAREIAVLEARLATVREWRRKHYASGRNVPRDVDAAIFGEGEQPDLDGVGYACVDTKPEPEPYSKLQRCEPPDDEHDPNLPAPAPAPCPSCARLRAAAEPVLRYLDNIGPNGPNMREAFRTALAATPLPGDGWIRVEDRMPDEKNGWSETVQIVADYSGTGGTKLVEADRTYNGKWERYQPSIVTHWMPLPDPPENPRSQDSAT